MSTLPNLTTKALGRKLIHLAHVDSTNNYLKEHAHNLPDLTVALADRQTQGKGRSGRSWDSQPGEGLYMSVLVKRFNPQDLSRMPLIVAMGVRRGLEALCDAPFEIKWSNDVLHEGKKLCGILCESRLSPNQSMVAVGVGVNLTQTREALDRLGLVYASSLFLATNKLFLPKDAAAAICNALERIFDQNSAAGFGPLREEYRGHCVTLGKQVKVTRNSREMEGRAIDINDDGSLLCEIDNELMAIPAGEATIRGSTGYS